MIDMKRTAAVLPTALAAVRPQTTTPGADVEASARGTGAYQKVPLPTAALESDPHMALFAMALARIARNAVSEGRQPTLAVGAMDSRKSKMVRDQRTILQRVGGGARDTDTPTL
jgi:hypothetical protein